MLVITSFKYILIDQLKKQMSDGNSTCPLDPMDKQNSNGHFQVLLDPLDTFVWLSQWPNDVHMLVITSFKDMLIDQLKKQMSDGNSTCPLDPMDTRKSNGQLEIDLTNGMSNGLLIFPSDILHRYWTLIEFLSNSYDELSNFRKTAKI
jgi:hypothetical protein